MTEQPQTIRDKIATRVIGTLAPAMALLIFSNIVAIFFLSPDQWTRKIPTYIVGGMLLLDWFLIRKGAVRIAADLFIAVCGGAIFAGMVLNGGIHAPVFSVTFGLLAIVAWLHGKRGAIVYIAIWGVASSLILVLQSVGMLPVIAPPPPGLQLFFMSTYLLLTAVATVVPSEMLHQSFRDSELRRDELETAHRGARETAETLRKRERALMDSEALFRALVADLPGTAYRTEGTDRWQITYLSDAVERLTGYPPEEFKENGKRTYASIVHPQDLPVVTDTIRNAVLRRAPFSVEYRILHSSGEERRVLEKGRAVSGDNDEIRCINGIVMDITQEIHREEMLRQAQKMQAVGQLAGGIAHDFNNMLACIMGFAEMAIEDLPEESPLVHGQQQILAASNRSKQLVEQILTFSRHGTGEMKHLSLNELLEESIDLFKGSMPASIVPVVDLDEISTAVSANAVQVHEVILNVATNAVHAMEEKGTLTFRLREISIRDKMPGRLGPISPGRYGIVTVADSGSGMDREVLDKIFDPFFTTKPPGSGTGMGLSVVWGIMQNHNGNISIESEVGIGTTVNLYFPLTQSLPDSRESQPTVDLSNGEHILFVDDETMIADLFQRRLQQLGYEVTALTSPIQAAAMLQNQRQRIDLLITDQTMPEMTGLELIREAKRLRPALPVILCTGYSSTVNDATAKAMGIDRFLLKPIRKKEIQAAVHEVLCERAHANVTEALPQE